MSRSRARLGFCAVARRSIGPFGSELHETDPSAAAGAVTGFGVASRGRACPVAPAAVGGGFGGARGRRAHYAGNGYHYEAEEVARCVGAGLTESDRMPLDRKRARSRR